MDAEESKGRRRATGGDDSDGLFDTEIGGDGDGEGCFGCLLLPFKAVWVVIKGVVGLIVTIGDFFSGGGDGD